MKRSAAMLLLGALLFSLPGAATAQDVIEDAAYELRDGYYEVSGWFRNTGNAEALSLVKCTFYDKNGDVIHSARISVLDVVTPVPPHKRARFEYSIHQSRLPGLDSMECVPGP